MKLEFYNCPQPKEIEKITLSETPEFVRYVPDFELIKNLAKAYEKYKNILVIGHGGSITSFYGFYQALKFQATKQAYFLSTVDPDYIAELKKELTPQDTLVIAVSKSGETITQIEILSQFLQFPTLIITGKSSSLRAIGEKLDLVTISAGAKSLPDKGLEKGVMILHPPIGGRYTGLTEVALVPAALCGLDVQGLFDGAKLFYGQYQKDNLAFKAASVLYQLEEKGFVDVFMPFYSHNLFPLSAVIVQLCHESFGKAGKGQTYFAHEAPESQHHTNQRFFGGTKNICGFFTSVENFKNNLSAVYPPSLHSVQIKGHAMFDVNKMPLSGAMEFELQGTMEDARIQGIPMLHLSITSFTPQEIGGLVAFWQLYAVYASVLRGVDPFDQPQVESSKKISFNKRLAYKGLL